MSLVHSVRLGFLVMLLGAAGAQALECPQPQAIAKPGVIEEPEAAIKSMAALFAGPDVVKRAPEIVAQTRLRYPKAQSAEIVNFLLTAYCPVANAQNVSDAEKQALVNAFAGAVTQQLY